LPPQSLLQQRLQQLRKQLLRIVVCCSGQQLLCSADLLCRCCPELLCSGLQQRLQQLRKQLWKQLLQAQLPGVVPLPLQEALVLQ
jgi:hypothetical protein